MVRQCLTLVLLAGCSLFVVHCANSSAVAQTIGLNFTGVTKEQGALLNSNSGYAPPDNAGAVGQAHVVQLINGAFAVYDKSTGTQIEAISGRQFWINAGVDPGTGISNLGAFNQRIIFDPTTDRWFAAALTADSVDNSVMIARSDTSDPTGSWQAVSFLGNVGGTGRFVDYTTFGLDANGVYIGTTNFTSITGTRESSSVFSVPKADLLSSTPTLANMTRFDSLNSGLLPFIGSTIQPVINFGAVGDHAPLFGTAQSYTDTLLYRTELMNTASAGATMTPEAVEISVPAYSFPPKAGQPDGTRAINLIDSRFKSQVVQVGDTIYAVHDVLANGNAAVQWYKIDETTNEILQSGTISDPAHDYYQASIAASANGDIVIGFNQSGLGADGQISILAAYGTTAGGLTTFGDPMTILAGTVDNYHYLNSRWGDYTTTLVDPFDSSVFWTFQQYAITADSWGTRITQILVPEPAGYVLAFFAMFAFVTVARRLRNSRTA